MANWFVQHPPTCSWVVYILRFQQIERYYRPFQCMTIHQNQQTCPTTTPRPPSPLDLNHLLDPSPICEIPSGLNVEIAQPLKLAPFQPNVLNSTFSFIPPQLKLTTVGIDSIICYTLTHRNLWISNHLFMWKWNVGKTNPISYYFQWLKNHGLRIWAISARSHHSLDSFIPPHHPSQNSV